MELMDGKNESISDTSHFAELCIGYSIRVPKESVDAVDLESIPLNDNSGDVWVSMNIYHHLHCLVSHISYLSHKKPLLQPEGLNTTSSRRSRL